MQHVVQCTLAQVGLPIVFPCAFGNPPCREGFPKHIGKPTKPRQVVEESKQLDLLFGGCPGIGRIEPGENLAEPCETYMKPGVYEAFLGHFRKMQKSTKTHYHVQLSLTRFRANAKR